MVDARTRLEGERLPSEEDAEEDDRKPREKAMTRAMITAAALFLITGAHVDPLPQRLDGQERAKRAGESPLSSCLPTVLCGGSGPVPRLCGGVLV